MVVLHDGELKKICRLTWTMGICHLKIKIKKNSISFFELHFKARYEVFTAGTVKTTGIWDVILCSFLEI